MAEGNGVQRELGSHEARLDSIDAKLESMTSLPADIAWIKAKLEHRQERSTWIRDTVVVLGAALLGGISGNIKW